MVDRTGQQIGAFRLIRQSGSGPYGAIYQVEREQQDWDVYQAESTPSPEDVGGTSGSQLALKLFHAELSSELQNHFSTEVQELKLKLQHTRIAPIHSSGFAGSSPYAVTDLFASGSLRKRHTVGERVPLRQVLTYVQQIAEALQFAHERGIVHRDLKPQNILLRQADDLVLTDFGIGAILHAAGPLTRFELAESVPYAAPELLQGRPQPASDQYTLAVLVYEWLCGVRPFTGSQESIISQHQNSAPAPLRVYEPGVLPAVEAVVLRALAKDPQARYPSVRDFAQAFAQAAGFAGNYSYSASTPAASVAYSGPSSRGTQAPAPATPLFSAGAQIMLGGIGLVAGAGLAALGTVLTTFPEPPVPVGGTLHIIGLFLIAAGLFFLAPRLINRARTLILTAAIVFAVPLIGSAALSTYGPGYLAQASIYVISPQERDEVLATFSTVGSLLLILSLLGLIIVGLALLNTEERLPGWTRVVGWGLIVSCAYYSVLLVLDIFHWLPDSAALVTIIGNLGLISFFLIFALLALLGYALLTTSPAPTQTAGAVQSQ